jgi:membrane protein DedA with SNARE-associated domain
METLIPYLQSLPPLLVYFSVFFISFVENLFPPSPSDVVIVFAGSLVGLGQVSLFPALVASTLGSSLGFVAMYKIGHWFGKRILEAGKIPFIPVESVIRVESWFARYGYAVIVLNRFLAGTRAVVSFFAGMSELHLGKTLLLSFLSAFTWNAILLGTGYTLGRNWERIGFYLATYSQVVTGLIIIALLIVIGLSVARNRKPPAQ